MISKLPRSVKSSPGAHQGRRTLRPFLRGLGAALCLAAIAVHAEPSSGLGVTEVSEATHPFQTLQCARLPVQFRLLGAALELVVDDESRILMPTISASGARYQAPGDPDTEFWSKGPLATITWSGEALPQCAPAGTVVPPFRASGNEPFWSVVYDGWTLTLQKLGEQPSTVDAQVIETRSDGQTVQGGEGHSALLLRVDDGICVDSMSGLSRPQQVTLHHADETLSGCGGDPARLLQGVEWKIVSLAGKPTPADAPASLAFLLDGKLAGNTGCNRFFGTYTLTGEGLDVGQLGSTRMACAPDRMEFESRFTQSLMSVRGFTFDADGVLILKSSDGDMRAVAN